MVGVVIMQLTNSARNIHAVLCLPHTSCDDWCRGLNIVVSGAETVLSLVIRPLCAVKTFTNDTEGRKLLSMMAGQELW